MNTRFIQLKNQGEEPETLFEASRIVAGGGVVIFPTETVYGIGGDGSNPRVVERIFRIKKRKPGKPLVRLIADLEDIRGFLGGPEHVRLLETFWPGPLTVVLTASGCSTRGYRMPDHDFVRSLAARSGIDFVATSANISGEPAITNGAVARREFDGLVDLIIDGGEVGGDASTVLDLTSSPERLLREGPVTREEIESCLGHRVATEI